MATDGKLLPVEFKPGFSKNATEFESQARWINGDKVRFQDGRFERIGGCTVRDTSKNIPGIPRFSFGWETLEGRSLIAFGSEKDFVITSGYSVYSILPVLSTVLAADITQIDVTSGSSKISVTFTSAHPFIEKDVMAFSADLTIGSVSLFPKDIYQFVPADSTTTVAVFETSNTFASTETVTTSLPDVQRLVPEGSPDNTASFGWGAGTWGSGPWGGPSTSGTGVPIRVRQWSGENYGEDFVFCPDGNTVFYWNYDASTYTRPTALSNAPSTVGTVFVAEPSPNIVTLGSVPFGGTDYDPMLVRWSSDIDPNDWDPTTSGGTAGGIRLHGGSRIVGYQKTRRETLISTDTTLFIMSPVPGSVFGFESIAENCGFISKRATVSIDGLVYWMGRGSFFVFDGSVQPIRSTMNDEIFERREPNSINFGQIDKIHSGVNRDFNEIWWFYPSRDSIEIDRYVVYNYKENFWFGGTWDRTTWLGDSVFRSPLATSPEGVVYDHEVGFSDAGEPLNSFIVSGEFDIGEGDDIMYADRFIPDFVMGGNLQLYVKSRKFPGSTNFQEIGPFEVTATTDRIDLGIRGRSLQLRFINNEGISYFREGLNRLEVQADGKR